MADITDKSSPAELAEAARQLSAARNDYIAWKKTLVVKDRFYPAQGNLPAETVKEMFDPAKGSFVSLNADDAKKREIVTKYDYVTLANGSSSTANGDGVSVNIQGSSFAVKGKSDKLDTYLQNAPSTSAFGDDAATGDRIVGIGSGSSSVSNKAAKAVDNQALTTGVNDASGIGGAATDSPDLKGASTTPAAKGAKSGDVAGSTSDTSVQAPGNLDPVTKGDTTPASGNGVGGSNGGGIGGPSLLDDKTSSDTKTFGGAGSNLTGTANGETNKGSIKKRPNILHDYVNWTYQIGWYMLDIATFNNFVTTGEELASTPLRKRPIFKSGGFKSAESDPVDFDLGLTSLRLTGIVGNGQFSPNANQFQISMEIVEPFGISLLAKLRVMANKLGGSNNEYQIPYLLEIKWLGYDDNGHIVTNIPDSGPKLIAVKIVSVDFNVTSAGTTYTITFAPYAQTPLSAELGVVRTDISLYGGTFEEVLKTGTSSLLKRLNQMGATAVAEGRAKFADEYDFEIFSYGEDSRPVDTKLADSKLTFPVEGGDIASPSLYAMSPDERDALKQTWTFTAGSNIKDIIADLAKNSTYFQDLIDPADRENKALQLVKVIPLIKKLGDYDPIRGVYQKTIVYRITPYYMYGQISPRTGSAPVTNRGYVKEYNWLFTGKNEDVYNVDLKYNVSYFRLFQVAPNPKALAENSLQTIGTKTEIQQDPPGNEAIPVTNITGDIDARTSKGDKPNAVHEYIEQLLSPSAGGDLVKLDLDIIGDPDWIPQDRSVRPKDVSLDANNTGYVDGTLAKGISVDVDGIYVLINFRSPTDYNDKTGLMQLTEDQVLVSGFYQVVTVDSVFENGKFTQKLNMVRAPSQKKNKVTGEVTSTTTFSGSMDLGTAGRGSASGGGPNPQASFSQPQNTDDAG